MSRTSPPPSPRAPTPPQDPGVDLSPAMEAEARRLSILADSLTDRRRAYTSEFQRHLTALPRPVSPPMSDPLWRAHLGVRREIIELEYSIRLAGEALRSYLSMIDSATSLSQEVGVLVTQHLEGHEQAHRSAEEAAGRRVRLVNMNDTREAEQLQMARDLTLDDGEFDSTGMQNRLMLRTYAHLRLSGVDGATAARMEVQSRSGRDFPAEQPGATGSRNVPAIDTPFSAPASFPRPGLVQRVGQGDAGATGQAAAGAATQSPRAASAPLEDEGVARG